MRPARPISANSSDSVADPLLMSSQRIIRSAVGILRKCHACPRRLPSISPEVRDQPASSAAADNGDDEDELDAMGVEDVTAVTPATAPGIVPGTRATPEAIGHAPADHHHRPDAAAELPRKDAGDVGRRAHPGVADRRQARAAAHRVLLGWAG